MAKTKKKYVGWGIAYELYGQKGITIVPAKTKEEAICQIEALQLEVLSKAAVKRVCVVSYPGHIQIRAMPEQDWNDCFEVIEDNEEAQAPK